MLGFCLVWYEFYISWCGLSNCYLNLEYKKYIRKLFMEIIYCRYLSYILIGSVIIWRYVELKYLENGEVNGRILICNLLKIVIFFENCKKIFLIIESFNEVV